MGKVTKSGIDAQFQDQVRGMLKPGTSALFLMVEKVTPGQGRGTHVRLELVPLDRAGHPAPGLLFTVALFTFRKGHWVLGLIGIFIPILWILGAILPARRGSHRA